MSAPLTSFPVWLTQWMQSQKIVQWGAADLRGFSTPQEASGQGFPSAISWVIPMTPQVMADIRSGPNQAYADEYDRVNQQINEMAGRLAEEISSRGFR